MSFVATHRARRTTWLRLAAVLGIGLAALAAIGLFAPLVGVEQTSEGRALVIDSFGDDWYRAARLPRMLAALLVGGALAGAGCALQALLRNPLAEPFTLGISSGSALGAVLAIRFGVAVAGGAIVGALLTLTLVSSIARVGRHLPPATLILGGVAISMWCASISVLVQYTSDPSEIGRMVRWMIGQLDDMRLGPITYAAPAMLAGLVVLVAHARALDALAAGPEVAASLGVAVGRTQLIVFAVASLLVGGSIALCGPIGFVGLIIPHVLRALLGADHRLLLPASILGGALLLALCDTLARLVLAPTALLPTGAVTAALGGPFFVAILVQQRRRAALWSGT
jgi:iron complex transport system permease protein